MSVIFVDYNDEGETHKMNTCKHRSAYKIDGEVDSCCGNKKKIKSYKCEKRNIYPLSIVECNACSIYEKR